MFLQYFSKRFIHWHQIDALIASRRLYKKNKVVNHNNNFVEVIKMEKSVRVVDRDDELTGLIKTHLVPAMSNVQFTEKNGELIPYNYDFDSLPSKLKSYMKFMDVVFYQKQIKERKIDWDEYERRIDKLHRMKPDYTDDEFEKHILLGHPIPNSKYKNAKESARRAYKKVNGLLKSNINRFECFVTFTFAPEQNKEKHLGLNKARDKTEKNMRFTYVNGLDFEVVKTKFTQTMNDFSKKVKSQVGDFQYLAVWELQKNGAYHFHLVTTKIPEEELYKVPSWLDYDHKKDIYEKGYGLNYWKYGKSDVQKIKNHAQISTYLTKYILKGFYNIEDEETLERYKGQKKYFPSRGLIKPVEEYFEEEELDRIMNELELEKYKPYHKEIINPYNNGLIQNDIYTKIEQKKELTTKEDQSINQSAMG